MKYNLLNWILDTVSLGLVMISSKDYQIFYLLGISCGNPILYLLGIRDDRKNSAEYSKSNIRIFRRQQGQLDFGDGKERTGTES